MTKEEINNTLEGVCQDCIWLEKIKPLFEQQQERIAYLERSNNRREQQIIEQRDEIIELECIRDKAIELLEKGITFCENDSQGVYDKCNIAINREKKVLEILKGNDK